MLGGPWATPAGDGSRRRFFGASGIDAPRPGTSKHEVEEHETIEDRQIAGVLDRIDRTWRVRHEVGKCHIAGQNEPHRPSEQTKDEQWPADKFDYPLIPDQGADRRRVRIRHRESEQFDKTVLKKQQADDDSEQAKNVRCPAGQRRVYSVHCVPPVNVRRVLYFRRLRAVSAKSMTTTWT